ncbi:hypothetical protein ACP70R_021836 [Stipagrostis hirtigluma subsp. patula]
MATRFQEISGTTSHLVVGLHEARLALTVQAERLAAHFAQLVADVERGSVPMEASTIVPGRVTILGVFKRHAVAYSECKFVFGVAELKVRSQECNGRTKL